MPYRLVTQAFKPRDLRALPSNEDGVAAAEFSILAPVIVMLYLGLAELSMVMASERHVAHSASVAGDMVAQVTNVDADDMADIFAATLQVSQVSDPQDYVIEITSFEMDDDGNILPLGRAVYGSGNRALLNAVDPTQFGEELLSETSGVVVANVAYNYQPLGAKYQRYRGEWDGAAGQMRQVREEEKSFLNPTVTLRETFMLKPRRSDSVMIGAGGENVLTCSGTGSATTCAAPAESES